jgi:hypothetical protein
MNKKPRQRDELGQPLGISGCLILILFGSGFWATIIIVGNWLLDT